MFRFKVMPDDGDAYEVVGTTRDIAKWEKTNKGASLHVLQSQMRATDLYKIAYNAVTRHGLFEGSFKDFEDSTDLDILDDEDVDPTPPAAS